MNKSSKEYDAMRVQLRSYNNKNYSPGNIFKRVIWYIFSRIFFQTCVPWPFFLKASLLRLFGAHIGTHVILKPHLYIKYPWFLHIGSHSWIGEYVWIDNLTDVYIADNVCVSQRSLLLTGNHDYTKTTFDLRLGKIHVESGAWIGACSLVCPGVICGTHSILCAGSTATKSLKPYTIYQGNPASKKADRVIHE